MTKKASKATDFPPGVYDEPGPARKKCEKCGKYSHVGKAECPACGATFTASVKRKTKAKTTGAKRGRKPKMVAVQGVEVGNGRASRIMAFFDLVDEIGKDAAKALIDRLR
jgi:uncharacterized OB-fold protein